VARVLIVALAINQAGYWLAVAAGYEWGMLGAITWGIAAGLLGFAVAARD
jgi:hypothetical protein